MAGTERLRREDALTVFLTAAWRDLLLLNYEVDPGLLARHAPAGTALDLLNGKAYVSLVGFRFLRTRLFGVPAILHQAFDEINLRFYVWRRIAGEQRRGVVFLRELVARPLVALIARAAYNEPYRVRRLRHDVLHASRGVVRAQYSWRERAGWCRLTSETEGDAYAYERRSDEEFFTERAWGYTLQRDGGTIEYRVTHPSWRVWRARDARFEGDAAASFGTEFARILDRAPDSAIVAEGSAVEVHLPSRV